MSLCLKIKNTIYSTADTSNKRANARQDTARRVPTFLILQFFLAKGSKTFG